MLSNGLIEHEYDHVYAGLWDGEVVPAAGEVSEVRWIQPEALEDWLQRDPEAFSAWLPIVLQYWKEHAAPVSAAS